MVFGNGVKNIQAAAYNGARTVYGSIEAHLGRRNRGAVGGSGLPISELVLLNIKQPLILGSMGC